MAGLVINKSLTPRISRTVAARPPQRGACNIPRLPGEPNTYPSLSASPMRNRRGIGRPQFRIGRAVQYRAISLPLLLTVGYGFTPFRSWARTKPSAKMTIYFSWSPSKGHEQLYDILDICFHKQTKSTATLPHCWRLIILSF